MQSLFSSCSILAVAPWIPGMPLDTWDAMLGNAVMSGVSPNTLMLIHSCNSCPCGATEAPCGCRTWHLRTYPLPGSALKTSQRSSTCLSSECPCASGDVCHMRVCTLCCPELQGSAHAHSVCLHACTHTACETSLLVYGSLQPKICHVCVHKTMYDCCATACKHTAQEWWQHLSMTAFSIGLFLEVVAPCPLHFGPCQCACIMPYGA